MKMSAPAGLPIAGSIQCQKMSCQNGKMEPPVFNGKHECCEAHLVYFTNFTRGLPFGSITSQLWDVAGSGKPIGRFFSKTGQSPHLVFIKRLYNVLEMFLCGQH